MIFELIYQDGSVELAEIINKTELVQGQEIEWYHTIGNTKYKYVEQILEDGTLIVIVTKLK